MAEVERLRQQLEMQNSQLAERQQLVGHLQVGGGSCIVSLFLCFRTTDIVNNMKICVCACVCVCV